MTNETIEALKNFAGAINKFSQQLAPLSPDAYWLGEMTNELKNALEKELVNNCRPKQP